MYRRFSLRVTNVVWRKTKLRDEVREKKRRGTVLSGGSLERATDLAEAMISRPDRPRWMLTCKVDVVDDC